MANERVDPPGARNTPPTKEPSNGPVQPPGARSVPPPPKPVKRPDEVIKFQKKSGANPSPPAAGPEPVPADPRAFQEYLNRHGANPPLVVDGVVGPKTLAAAKQLGVTLTDAMLTALTGRAPTPAAPAAAPAAPDPAPPAPAAPAPLTAAQIQQTLREQYGYLGLLLDMPDVAQVLTDSIANELTPQQTLARLYDTATWKNTQASVRNWMALQGADPASAQAQVQSQQAAIRQTAATLGININADRLTQIATDSLKFGWNAQQINGAIGAEFQYKPGAQTGAVAAAESQIKKMGADYLMVLDDSTLADWDRKVAMGTDTPESFRAHMVTVAKARFPTLAKLLDSGATVAEVAEPYRQAAARELGVSADSIDFNDPKWSRALSYADPKSGERRLMDDYEWQRTLRTDEQYGWDRSKNGIAAGYRVGNALAEALGLRA